MKIRNPFLLRASERIESDAGFLRLYSPLILDYFIDNMDGGELWNTFLFIRSSPGAGKSSLLRLFEPTSLLTLLNRKSGDEFKEVFKKLKKLNAVSDDRINVLGVNLTFTRNYELLESFSNLPPGTRDRLFYSLLNSRIITATLRAALSITRLRFPEDLHKIEFKYKDENLYFKKINIPCNGHELYNWAAGIEKAIYELLDSFLPVNPTSIEGHSELFSLEALRPDSLLVEGRSLFDRILFMLDDVHKLSAKQREGLITHLLEKRTNASIWLSERLEVLNNLKTNRGRDYEELNLENYWKDRESKFEKLLTSIAVKRAAESREDVEFALDAQQSELELAEVYKEAKKTLSNTINTLSAGTTRFNEWKNHLFQFEGTDQETCELAKQIEILIHRNLAKSELALDYSLSILELQEKTDEKVVQAARLFLSRQFNLPYFFGMTVLAKISTNNVEQFLGFSAPLYERMLSLNLNQTSVSISARDQDREIRKLANEKWKDLNKMIPDSVLVTRFLENFCTFCINETFRPTAPYAPGVNGFYIDATRTIKLINEDEWLSNDIFTDLQIVLNTCLAFNLLHVKEVMQGKKGQKKNIYYLNRWLCVKFGLPLSYGGWRTKKPDDLLRWTKR
ncbi:hypothetical protein [Agriterribacter sp.]|uniref:ORC-CDC6 family AAA ATPase n=1 Tax=Agriterribacter sp. TaxID=2821509 RepID=UPI002B93E93A|nr:hypothetical protein [Agriterribacter sp.]HRO46232.1 hypothetical protein [Agriterribacter sp.]HRQ18487.1 hypothetical protein [Agriterribacter sp.]